MRVRNANLYDFVYTKQGEEFHILVAADSWKEFQKQIDVMGRLDDAAIEAQGESLRLKTKNKDVRFRSGYDSLEKALKRGETICFYGHDEHEIRVARRKVDKAFLGQLRENGLLKEKK